MMIKTIIKRFIVTVMIVFIAGSVITSYRLAWAKTSDEKAQIFHDRGPFLVWETYNGKLWFSTLFSYDYYERRSWL